MLDFLPGHSVDHSTMILRVPIGIYRVSLSFWMRGKDLREFYNPAKFARHSKVLLGYGFDITRPCPFFEPDCIGVSDAARISGLTIESIRRFLRLKRLQGFKKAGIWFVRYPLRFLPSHRGPASRLSGSLGSLCVGEKS